ncbi:hypothetical protein ESCO_001495 [Escovopsis weberi]|uniref:Uncharacterized protein n=1 Tax=Escovopsis weberi TaxID=150374 RepID=A0A0M9VWK3_ESCWE|nr:hypothetical protein ESCO_001495 [Escovopsis weberi]
MAEAAIEYYSSVSSSSSSFTTEKPQKRRRISRRAAEQQAREQQELEARQKHEAESRALALEYVQDFLQDSEEWADRMDFISIIYDAVPTMEELFSYGALDSSEGTRACRRLFKAVVIWDELGLSLWQKLAASEEAAAANSASVAITTVTSTISSVQEQQASDFETASTVVPCVPSRRASEDSGCSRLSFWSSLSRSSTASEKQRGAKRNCLSRMLARTWDKLSDKSMTAHASKGVMIASY